MGVRGRVWGPRTVTKVYQVSVPAALLRQVGLDKHSQVSFAVSDDDPSMICMFAADRVGVVDLPASGEEAEATVSGQ